MTKEKAMELSKSKFWENMTHREIFEFQINEPLLCMPFDIFHKSVEEILNRPVFTHEFVNPDSLIKESQLQII